MPTNYKGIPINTWHNNWHPDSVNPTVKKRVTWVTESGVEHSRNSIRAAANELGYNSVYLRERAKVIGKTLDSDNYGKVEVSVEGILKDQSSYDMRYGTPFNTIVDTSDLVPGKYYLYDSEMNQLPYGPFNTAREVNKALGLSTGLEILVRWVNYMHLIKSIALGVSVYVVKVQKDDKIPVVIKREEGTITVNSLSETAALVGVANSSSLLTSMVKETVFKGKSGKTYFLSYRRTEDHETAVKQYEKRLTATRAWKAAKKA